MHGRAPWLVMLVRSRGEEAVITSLLRKSLRCWWRHRFNELAIKQWREALRLCAGCCSPSVDPNSTRRSRILRSKLHFKSLPWPSGLSKLLRRRKVIFVQSSSELNPSIKQYKVSWESLPKHWFCRLILKTYLLCCVFSWGRQLFLLQSSNKFIVHFIPSTKHQSEQIAAFKFRLLCASISKKVAPSS